MALMSAVLWLLGMGFVKYRTVSEHCAFAEKSNEALVCKDRYLMQRDSKIIMVL